MKMNKKFSFIESSADSDLNSHLVWVGDSAFFLAVAAVAAAAMAFLLGIALFTCLTA